MNIQLFKTAWVILGGALLVAGKADAGNDSWAGQDVIPVKEPATIQLKNEGQSKFFLTCSQTLGREEQVHSGFENR